MDPLDPQVQLPPPPETVRGANLDFPCFRESGWATIRPQIGLRNIEPMNPDSRASVRNPEHEPVS